VISRQESNAAFKELMTAGSLKKYTKLIWRLLRFVLLASEDLLPEYTVPLTANQSSFCKDLLVCLRIVATNDQIRSNIHSLLFSLFVHEKNSGTADKYFSPVTRFLVLASVKVTGQFLKASEISQVVNILEYGGRSAVFYEILETMRIKDQSFFRCVAYFIVIIYILKLVTI
jgi:hypothetical protein